MLLLQLYHLILYFTSNVVFYYLNPFLIMIWIRYNIIGLIQFIIIILIIYMQIYSDRDIVI
jgi:hypothetical protein